MRLSEECKIINAGPPFDANGGGLDGVYINMENYKQFTAIVQLGVTAGTPVITVEKDADGSGSGSAITFHYRVCATAYNASGGDTLAADTTSASLTVSATDNIYYVIEVDADEIGPSYPFIRVRVSDTGASDLASIVYILSGPRYAMNVAPTALVS